jgi:hypothetical protein
MVFILNEDVKKTLSEGNYKNIGLLSALLFCLAVLTEVSLLLTTKFKVYWSTKKKLKAAKNKIAMIRAIRSKKF